MMEHVQGAIRPTTLRHLLAIAAVLLLAAVLFVGAAGAAESTNVQYLDSTGSMQTCSEATNVESSATDIGWQAGWYYVPAGTSSVNEVEIKGNVSFNGDVHLILGNYSNLTVSGYISGDSNLTIYSQSIGAEMGNLTVSANMRAKDGIYSSNNIVINGGKITATGATAASGISGANSVTINNGTVFATGENEGISSNDNDASSTQRSGAITINGGTVVASGNHGVQSGANKHSGSVIVTGGEVTFIGIYDGINSNYVEIRGGTVIAEGEDEGIQGKTVTISGGTVTATSSSDDGAGNYGIYSESVTISGGTVTATATTTATTRQQSCDGIYGNSVTISGGTVTTEGEDNGIIGGTVAISGGEVTATGNDEGIYGNPVTITGGTISAISNSIGISGGSGSTSSIENAFIIAKGFINLGVPATSGVFFLGDYYGYVKTTPTLNENATIPSGKMLKVEKVESITLNDDVTLTNNGTILNNGTIVGTGTLDITNGEIDNTAGTPDDTNDDGKVTAKVIGIKITSVAVSDVSVADKQTATFKPTVDSNYKPFSSSPSSATCTYQWKVSKDGGNTWTNIEGATAETYTINPVSMEMDGWQYQCIVTLNNQETTSNAATLDVLSIDTSIRHVKVHGLAGIIDDDKYTVDIALHHDMSLPTAHTDFDVLTNFSVATPAFTKTADDGSEWTLTITAESGDKQDYKVTITIKTTAKEENDADVAGVISHIQHHKWEVYCETANDSDAVEKWIKEQLEDVLGLEGATATVSVASITPATTDTAGTFTFTVTVTKGTGTDKATDTTQTITGTITLQPVRYNIEAHGLVGGTASASPTLATHGTTITLTATPSSGYTFKEWVVVEGGVTISNNQFTMPEQNVVIHAVFTALPPSPSDDSPSGSSIWLMETTTPTPTENETETPTPTDPTPTQTPDEGGLPLTGIIVGLVVLLAVVGIGVGVYLRKKN